MIRPSIVTYVQLAGDQDYSTLQDSATEVEKAEYIFSFLSS